MQRDKAVQQLAKLASKGLVVASLFFAVDCTVNNNGLASTEADAGSLVLHTDPGVTCESDAGIATNSWIELQKPRLIDAIEHD